jgi:hypothetical protein
MYKEKDFNRTDRKEANTHMAANIYYYRDKDNKRKTLDLTDRNKMYAAANVVNQTGKAFYSKCLDSKGNSQVDFNKPAGMPTKIQKKAYRSNTQNQQMDGLYKPDKFLARPAFINHTRTEYNIMNPYQKDVQQKLT